LSASAPLLEELERAGEELRDSTGQVRGTARVTASVAYGQTVLVPLMPALHEAHPGLEVDLLLSDAVFDLVSQRIDIALRLVPAVDSSLVGMQLRPVRFRVCASPAYLRQHGRPRRPADLAQCDCLRFPLPGYRTQWSFRGLEGGTESVALRGWLVMSTALALHRAAIDGLGPALLGDWLIDADLAAGRLVDLFPEHEVTATNFDSAVWLLYASREHVPRRVRAFVDFMKGRLGQLVVGTLPPALGARHRRPTSNLCRRQSRRAAGKPPSRPGRCAAPFPPSTSPPTAARETARRGAPPSRRSARLRRR